MKKLILFSAILLIAVSCKKIKQEPLGPTDVRIRNLSAQNMTNLTVSTSTSGGEYNYGALSAGNTTDYHRFDEAHPKAKITATIGTDIYTTGMVDYTYMQYFGLMKITYVIDIDNQAQKTLKISDVIQESALK
jgi:hypothetical protein